MQQKIESLQDAAKAGDLEATKKLLDDGADVNGKDKRGITPLGVAVGFNKIQIVDEFLSRGADVEACDPKGNTALHYAAGIEHLSWIERSGSPLYLFVGRYKLPTQIRECGSHGSPPCPTLHLQSSAMARIVHMMTRLCRALKHLVDENQPWLSRIPLSMS